MRSFDIRTGLAAALVVALLPAALAAQLPTPTQVKPLAIELRGGFNFAVKDLKNGIGQPVPPRDIPVAAAKQGGWTGSAALYWSLARRSAVYVGWDQAGFKCKEENCGSDGKLWSAGPEFGFRFAIMPDNSGFSPWFQLGLLAHKAKFKEGSNPDAGLGIEENSVRAPGIMAGIGTDLAFMNTFAIVPGIRYYGYNAGWDLGTPEAKRLRKKIGWFQADLGLQMRVGR
jgi:hypothetical protein